MWKPSPRSDELYHWGMKKGAKADKHKYVARIEDGTTKFGTPKYRYFYTQSEYQAYKQGLQGNQQQQGLMAKSTPMGNPTNPNAKPTASQLNTNKAKLPQKPLFTGSSNNNQQTVSGNSGTVSGVRDAIENVEDKIFDFFNKKKDDDEDKKKKEEKKKDKQSVLDKAKEKINNLFDKGKDDNKQDKAKDNPEKNTFKEEQNEKQNEVEIPKKDKSEYIDSLEHTSMEDLKQAEKDADKIYDNVQDQKLTDLKKQEYELTNEENASLVNPYYMYDWRDANGDGYQEGNKYTDNCSHCTLAYDMRMRGYDVEAAPSNPSGGESFEEVASWYEGGEFSSADDMLHQYIIDHPEEVEKLDPENPDDIIKAYANSYINEMAKGGPGARGQFCVLWQAGGGHSMAYEVQKDGSVDIVDCQENTRVKAEDFDWSSIILSEGGVMRTDNLELTDRAATKVINKENNYSNTNRSDPKDTNDKIDDNHADYFMKDGEQWFYKYENGKRLVLNPNTGNWTRG